MLPPERTAFSGPMALSPDGRSLAYVAVGPEGPSLLWVRRLDSLAAEPLRGTEGAEFPFWSPDGRSVGFFAQGQLKRIEVSGGPTQTLCEAWQGRRGTWNRDGVIVFAPHPRGGLYRIPASGGEPTPLTSLDAKRQEVSHRWPQFLPDGRRLLYVVDSGLEDNRGIHVASLDATEGQLLLSGVLNAYFASPGYLLFARARTLLVQPFDPTRLELSGVPVPLGVEVRTDIVADSPPGFSVADRVIAYRSDTENIPLVWVDRSGRPLGRGPALRVYSTNPGFHRTGRKRLRSDPTLSF